MTAHRLQRARQVTRVIAMVTLSGFAVAVVVAVVLLLLFAILGGTPR
jgi:hypothetical protein